MMRNCAACLFFICATAASAGDTSHSEDFNCADRLERSLAEMRGRPLLKEEHATALMWLRMDAAEAAAVGDEDGCLETVAVAEALLGLRAQEQ